MDALLNAIIDDDRAAVRSLLRDDPALATRLVPRPRLYQGKIFHWLYAGDTALHLAAAGHRAEIAALLLVAGSDPNARGKLRHATPLHYAADGSLTAPEWDAKRQVKTICCLLDVGADIAAKDKNGATPLHRAVRTRCAAAVRCLLEAGADPTQKNRPGSTPFHLAVQNTGRGGSGDATAIAAQREIVAEMLAYGVSPGLTDGRGRTVRDSASSAWLREQLAGGSDRR